MMIDMIFFKCNWRWYAQR